MSKVLGFRFWVLGAESRTWNILLLLCALLAGGCGAQPTTEQPHQAAIDWRTLGTYSGHGNEQTASFTSDSGVMQIVWEAKASGVASPSASFRLTIHSAISGRPLLVAVDHKGPGKGTAFVGEDPRVFFAVVDSRDLDWSFTVQERVN